MNTPTTKYHVRELQGLFYIYGADNRIFAEGVADQAKADGTCRSLNALFSEWPEKKGEVNA